MAAELLNHARHGDVAAEPLGRELADAVARIAARHYDAQRHRFDYGGAAVSGEYERLRAVAAELAGADPAELAGTPAALAFWINAYNLLVLHIILAGSITTPVSEREDFFTGPHYCIGGHECTLDAIEHGILRANARKYMGLAPMFRHDDPRLLWALPQRDPRIHFVLHAGALSSPRLRAIPPGDVDAALERAAAEYLDATVEADIELERIRLSAVFRWYTADFGGSLDDALAFVHARLPPGDRRRMLEREGVDVEFRPFDWRLNDRYASID